MTNEEATKWFEEELKDGKCSPDCVQCNANEAALNALRDKWVSVEDELPCGYIEGELGTAEPEEYIVQVGNAKSATVAMFDVSTKKFVPSIYSDTINFDGTVTHWQPLPEPPVGDDKYWTPENRKLFEEEMRICKGQRKDGRDGRCINSNMHNLGCWGCPIGDGGLFEPELLEKGADKSE